MLHAGRDSGISIPILRFFVGRTDSIAPELAGAFELLALPGGFDRWQSSGDRVVQQPTALHHSRKSNQGQGRLLRTMPV